MNDIIVDIRVRVVRLGRTEHYQFYRQLEGGFEELLTIRDLTSEEREAFHNTSQAITLDETGLASEEQ